jgi:hypothetical protein
MAAAAAVPPISLPVAKSFPSELAKVGVSIVVVYSAHYAATKSYSLVCVPNGWEGYLWGFITTSSPWCRLLLELMKVTENQYSTIILLVLSRLLLKGLGI